MCANHWSRSAARREPGDGAATPPASSMASLSRQGRKRPCRWRLQGIAPPAQSHLGQGNKHYRPDRSRAVSGPAPLRPSCPKYQSRPLVVLSVFDLNAACRISLIGQMREMAAIFRISTTDRPGFLRPILAGKMVGVARIELATPAMSTQCSTTELHAHRGPIGLWPGTSGSAPLRARNAMCKPLSAQLRLSRQIRPSS